MKLSISKAISITTLVLLPLMFSQCGIDDLTSTLTYSIDGEKQNVGSITATLQTSTDYDHEGRTLFITATNGVLESVSISVANWDFQNPPKKGLLEKTYDATFDYDSRNNNATSTCLALTGSFAGIHLCEGALITYINLTDVYFSAFDGNTTASVTITKCDVLRKRVSGSFSAKVQTVDNKEHTISGEFKVVRYLVF